MVITEIVVLATLGLATILGLLLAISWWTKRLRGGQGEPIIELEKLVNCKSCGSLIPEGVRKCAFCGAVQPRPRSGE